MIRLLSRIQTVQLARTLRRARPLQCAVANHVRACHLSGNNLVDLAKSTDLHENDSMQLAGLEDESVRPPPERNTGQPVDRLKELYECESMPAMLKWIETNIFRIKIDELSEVYAAINQLIFNLKRKNRVYKSLDGSLHMLRESQTFKLLLTHTDRFLTEFDEQQLASLFETFQWQGLNPRRPIVGKVIRLLSDRLNRLHLTDQTDLNEIVKCLKICHHYKQSSQSADLQAFYEQLIEIATQKIMHSEFDLNDVQHFDELFLIFLAPAHAPDYQVVTYLSNLILSREIVLDYRVSVLILKQLLLAYSSIYNDSPKDPEIRKRLERGELYPRVLAKLINHCNETICKTINMNSLNKSEEQNWNFHLTRVHAGTIPITKEFENFYDSRLLDPLVQYVLQWFDTHDRVKYLAINLALNYSHAGYYNEALLKFCYEYYWSANDRFRSNQNPRQIYQLFSKVRLPFVNHRRFSTELLFNFSDEFYRMIASNPFNPIMILSSLILNDVFDERLFVYLNASIRSRKCPIFAVDIYKQLALARNYLMLFGDWTTLKLETADLLNDVMAQSNIISKPPVAPGKLQKLETIRPNAYLSNGIYVDSFAIFDRTSKDLISLEPYTDLFYQIDCIPPKKDQQV